LSIAACDALQPKKPSNADMLGEVEQGIEMLVLLRVWAIVQAVGAEQHRVKRNSDQFGNFHTILHYTRRSMRQNVVGAKKDHTLCDFRTMQFDESAWDSAETNP
jgi:hypothetical protein